MEASQSLAVPKPRRHLSPEHKQKISERLRGRKRALTLAVTVTAPLETERKRRVLSLEHRRKISERLRGRKRNLAQVEPSSEVTWSPELAPSVDQLERRGIWSDIFNPRVPTATVQPKRKRGRPRIHNLPKLPENQRVHKLSDDEPEAGTSISARDRAELLARARLLLERMPRRDALMIIAAERSITYTAIFNLIDAHL